ncbi:hypothetical protein E2C01_029037 [Portunus trituberculatus]|uniref:Uncharacterized protein n=1 Tax=Portunus trituberculatus TaxID=210409 RepID=A0A5B7EMB1_PORTR|nr:hypothetical protein [Portunus trituberculatus]
MGWESEKHGGRRRDGGEVREFREEEEEERVYSRGTEPVTPRAPPDEWQGERQGADEKRRQATEHQREEKQETQGR